MTAGNHKISGNTVNSARKFAQRRRGAPGYDEFLDSLTEQERSMYEAPIRRGDWFDVPTYAAVLAKAAAHLAPDQQDDFLIEGGRFVVDDGVNTLYRAFFAIARPSFVLRGSAMLWRTFFRGSRLVVDSSTRRSVSARVEGGAFCSRGLCMTILGGMMSSLTHGGARGLAVDHHSCRTETGATDCEFSFSWR